MATVSEQLDLAEHLARIIDELIVPTVAIWCGAMLRRWLKLPPGKPQKDAA
jgi:hypothetical protein